MNFLSQFKHKNKRVLVRVDFNVPIKEGVIKDDRRIKAAIPTIKYLLKLNSKVILVAHLGRPDGKYAEEFSLKPIAKRLEELIKSKVEFTDLRIGDELKNFISKSKSGVFLLENIRFYPEEEENDKDFAKRLANLADFYVNDAFGTAHRANSSTEAVAHFLTSYAGLLLEEEINQLSKALVPKKPLIVILGGVKVSDKIGVINNFLKKAKYILIGGAMAFTFLKAEGYEVGKSVVEIEKLDLAKSLLKKGKGKIILPVDVVAAKEKTEQAISSVRKISKIHSDEIGLDIGPDTVNLFKSKLKEAKTIVWNGTLGLNEISQFADGTKETAKILSKSKADTIIGGGDTAAVVDNLNLGNKMTHVSTGGGASLEFLEGKKLPAIKALK